MRLMNVQAQSAEVSLLVAVDVARGREVREQAKTLYDRRRSAVVGRAGLRSVYWGSDCSFSDIAVMT